MKYYLDTNIIIYYLNGKYPAIKEHMIKVPSHSIVIPTIVKAEIEYGAYKSNNYKKISDKYRRFMDMFSTESFDEECVKTYGRIRAELENKGTPIGPNDLMIAATVISKDGILVTHNTKEFSKINDLKIIDWTK